MQTIFPCIRIIKSLKMGKPGGLVPSMRLSDIIQPDKIHRRRFCNKIGIKIWSLK